MSAAIERGDRFAILGMSRREISARFDEIVAFAEVERFLDTPVKRYSSGMNLRLAFAVAAHLEPEILIVDEVLAVGDASFQKKCLGKMGEARDAGRTVIFVSHNLQAVKQLCNRGAVLRAGELVLHGSAEDAVDHYLKGGARSQPTANLADAIEMLPSDPIFRFEEIAVTQDGECVDLVDNGRPLDISMTYRLVLRATLYNQRPLTPPGGVSAVLQVGHAGRYNRSYLGDTFRGKIAPCLAWKTEQIDAA